MDTGEAFGREVKKPVNLLTIAVRFVPYDQWLVTHVDSSWTIAEVKAWILAKCTANNAPAQSCHLPPFNPPTKPNTKPPRRPASPIIFADFSPVDGAPTHGPGYNLDGPVKAEKSKKQKKRRARGRPISPITFAPIGGADPRDRDNYDPFGARETEGEVIGMGYEEDDEWESEEDDSDAEELEFELDQKSRLGRPANRNQYLGNRERPSMDQSSTVLPPPTVVSRASVLAGKTALASPSSLPKGSFSTYHPNLLTLIRFSTGQMLERHLTIQDYEIKPYELLEVHRLGVVVKLPREIPFKYVIPYWEGWVKALRVVFRDPRATEARLQHERRKDQHISSAVDDLLKTALDGTYLTNTPGNHHAESARRTMEILAGGSVKVSPFAPPDVALGIRPNAIRKSAKKNNKTSLGNELDLFTSLGGGKLSSSKDADKDKPGLSRSATVSSSKPSSSTTTTTSNATSLGESSYHHHSHQRHHHSRAAKGGKLEWRERWMFIKDGVLHLKKENSESAASTTTQVLPLDSLAAIRGVEQLGKTASATIPIMGDQRIVCAKFRTRMTTAKFAPPSSSPPGPSQARGVSSYSQASAIPSSSVSKSILSKEKESSYSGRSKPSASSQNPSSSRGRGAGGGGGGSSSNTATEVRQPTSPLSMPRINKRKIQPLSPPPTVIQGKIRTSSLGAMMSASSSTTDKGKGKAPAHAPPPRMFSGPAKLISASESTTRISSGPPSEAASENPSEAPTDDEQGVASDDEGGGGERKQKTKKKITILNSKHKRESAIIIPPPYPETGPGTPTSERRHPAILLDSDSANSDGNDSGGTLSSPVFAHSDDEDVDSPFSDTAGGAGSGSRGYGGYGYGYYHFGGNSEWQKRRKAGLGGAKDKVGGIVVERRNGKDSRDREEYVEEHLVEEDTSFVVDAEEVKMSREKEKSSSKKRRPSTAPSKHSSGHREKPDPDSEWIVLDLGDDFALRSFLRIIHRHAPHAIDSSFLSSLPSFQMPKPTVSDCYVPAAPAPTPTFTSPAQSSSPKQPMSPGAFSQFSWDTVRQERFDRYPIAEEVSPLTPVPANPSKEEGSPLEASSSSLETRACEATVNGTVNDTPPGTQTPSATVPSPKDSHQFRLPPPSLNYASLSGPPTASTSTIVSSNSHASSVFNSSYTSYGRKHSGQLNVRSSIQKNSLGTFGALPYPEWRIEIVTKAQRAGMGELTRAMDSFLWSDNPGLALLSRDLGLSLAPMEFISSPSIRTAGDRSSLIMGDSAEEEAARRQRKRRDRRMTLQQESLAIGDFALAEKMPENSIHQRSEQYIDSASSLSTSAPSSSIPPMGNNFQSTSSLRLGYIDPDSSESGEESSDAEWIGWMADLHRQAKVSREEEVRRNRQETESVASSIDTTHFWDYQQQDDHRRYHDERMMLEPFAIVTSSSTPPTVPTSPVSASMQQQLVSSPSASSHGFAFGSSASIETSTTSSSLYQPATPSGDRVMVSTYSVLTSPSSNESLSKSQGRRLSFGLSPSDPPSSATSPSLSQVGPTIEVSHHTHEYVSSRANIPHRSVGRDGHHLAHYASTGLIGSSSIAARELEFHNSSRTSARRPSMPSLNSSFSTARSDGLPSPPPIPGSSLARSVDNSASSASVPRRSSISGLMNSASSSSLGRSGSMLGKTPGLLRKKEPEAKQMVDHDRESKGKQRSKGKEREQMLDTHDSESRHRPRLSLSVSTSSVRQLHNQGSTSGAVSPPTSPTLASKDRIIRRIKSGQSLLSGGEETKNKTPPAKKKKGLVREKAEKLLQGLESTLDFVDAR